MTCLSSKSGCDGKNNVGSHFITGETRTTNQSAKERDCPPLGAATSSPPPSTTTTTRPHSPTHWVKPRRANPLRAKSLFISTPSCPAPSFWPSCCGALRRPPLLLRPPPPPENKAQRTKGQGWDCHGCCSCCCSCWCAGTMYQSTMSAFLMELKQNVLHHPKNGWYWRSVPNLCPDRCETNLQSTHHSVLPRTLKVHLVAQGMTVAISL